MRTTGAADRAMTSIDAALSELADVDLASLSSSAQVSLLARLRGLQCRLDAQFTRAVDTAHASGAAVADGGASTVSWLRGQLHLGGSGRRVKAAVGLRHLPEMAQVFAAGKVSFEHVAIATRITRHLDPKLLEGGVDALLAEQACLYAPDEFQRAAIRIRDYFNPDAADHAGRGGRGEHWLSVSPTFGGAVSIDGVLAADAGELLIRTLHAYTPPPKLDDPRPADARRADALADICRAATTTAPTNSGEKPHVVVTITLDELRESTARLCHPDRPPTTPGRSDAADPASAASMPGTAGHPDSSSQPDAAGPVAAAGPPATTNKSDAAGRSDTAGRKDTESRPGARDEQCTRAGSEMAGPLRPDGTWIGARLGSGTPITAAAARRLACDATVVPVVLGAASEPLDIGRVSRTVSVAIRRALILRDGTCRFPGCDRPPQWTDAHHLKPWADGGPTDLDNLLLLCAHHHGLVHEGGWWINHDLDTGIVTVRYPDGQPYNLVSRPRSHSP